MHFVPKLMSDSTGLAMLYKWLTDTPHHRRPQRFHGGPKPSRYTPGGPNRNCGKRGINPKSYLRKQAV